VLDGLLKLIASRGAHEDPASILKGWGEGKKFLPSNIKLRYNTIS